VLISKLRDLKSKIIDLNIPKPSQKSERGVLTLLNPPPEINSKTKILFFIIFVYSDLFRILAHKNIIID
jgi:hypothetical protein